MQKSVLLFLSVILFVSCTREPVKPVVSNGIFLNEVAAKGSDWLEIYNGTGASVNLSGYMIYDDPALKFTLPSMTIAAGGFVVLYCDGTGVGDHTNFGLSSQGETIFLEDPKGTLVDQVDFPAMSGSQSYARFPDGTGDWKLTGAQTQLATNGDGAYASLRNASREPLVPGLTDAVTVSVEASDAAGLQQVKLFYSINGAGYQSVDMTAVGSIYSATIPAANSVGTVDYYIQAVNTQSLISYQPTAAPAQPYQYILNTDALPQLYINEFMAFNVTCCPDVQMGVNEFDDWIEIYNAGDTPVDVGGMYLSDSLATPFKFLIAKTNSASTTIPAKGYLVIHADEQGSQGILHANFKLNQSGEEIGLFYIDGRMIDSRIFGQQLQDLSEGRSPDGSDSWFKMTPSKGSANN
jgi:hypothetical protein